MHMHVWTSMGRCGIVMSSGFNLQEICRGRCGGLAVVVEFWECFAFIHLDIFWRGELMISIAL
ncbi:hypothetical protein KP509_30G060100 [Ceratopteris richardii]|uniref:Uncharacterized protein n=1 Tax=Ceratopteris richardii TaxID=49495 RepID=A0A8T2R3W9_CERRI|nr:hypothetical protein KP509_30G060100 [Ceratopteris richardii]